ncbi:hypothetical protein E4U55_004509 [Claviceps digitariae]|nr:hypothetical protein E4U55_004509 [Claviceps digitariae]
MSARCGRGWAFGTRRLRLGVGENLLVLFCGDDVREPLQWLQSAHSALAAGLKTRRAKKQDDDEK